MTTAPGLGNTLVCLSTLIQRRYTQICADHDLTTAQAQLLCMVKDEPRGMRELGQRLGLAKPGLSGLIDRVERRGLVERVSCEEDRRTCTVASTPLGRQVGRAVSADVAARLPAILDDLPATDRATFARLVTAILPTCP